MPGGDWVGDGQEGLGHDWNGSTTAASPWIGVGNPETRDGEVTNGDT
jgi:hypothetical protein